MSRDVCEKCGCQLFVAESALVLVDDDTPELPTRAYERQYLVCRNQNCENKGIRIECPVELKVASNKAEE